MWLFILFSFILTIIIASPFICGTSRKKRALRDKLNNLIGFVVTKSYIGEDGNSAIAVDSINKKICLLKFYRDQVKPTIVPYRDLTSAEIFAERGNTAGTPFKRPSGIMLRIVIANTAEPVHIVYFFAGEYKIDSPPYQAVEQAKYWKDLLGVFMLQADKRSS